MKKFPKFFMSQHHHIIMTHLDYSTINCKRISKEEPVFLEELAYDKFANHISFLDYFDKTCEKCFQDELIFLNDLTNNEITSYPPTSDNFDNSLGNIFSEVLKFLEKLEGHSKLSSSIHSIMVSIISYMK